MRGLEDFRKAFEAFSGSYVLIGGAACEVWLAAAGARSRATRDLDLVLIIEALDAGFVHAFWRYVDTRGYSCATIASGGRRYYRFESPSAPEAPEMIELFSRESAFLPPGSSRRITRLVADGDVASLSAILLNDDYYALVRDLRQDRGGLSLLPPLGLIPLKVRAYLDLGSRKAAGEPIDAADIRKHRSDVFRLLAVINPAERLELSPTIRADLVKFLEEWNSEPFDWKVFAKSLGLPAAGLADRLIGTLVSIYTCTDSVSGRVR